MLFKSIYKNELAGIGIDEAAIDTHWKEIVAAYTRKRRYYHNLLHLDKVIEQLLPVKNEIADWSVIVFSVAYHDIVYNPLKQDNEQQSADLAYERLSE